jgi:hypothetical protein
MGNDLLADRVSRLERSNRRLRRWLIVVTFALIASILIPCSVVWNVARGQAAYVTALGDTAVMTFQDNRQKRRLQLGVVSQGSPALLLLGRDERPRIGISVNENDTPIVSLYDGKSGAGVEADLLRDGWPRIQLRAPEGKGWIDIGFSRDGYPSMKFADKDGKIDFEIPPRRESEGRPPRS